MRDRRGVDLGVATRRARGADGRQVSLKRR